jgi:hypothetical protein
MIYEFKKGIRPLFLHTFNKECINRIILRLEHNNIDFFCLPINEKRINIFFGEKECIEIIKSFNFKTLRELTPEQDFILGILLGYDCMLQCKRYLKMSQFKSLKDFSEISNSGIWIVE